MILEQCLNTVASNSSGDAKLHQMRTQRIDRRRSLANDEADACDEASVWLVDRVSLWEQIACLGRVTASQMASASVASFFCDLTYGFT